jgi:hypothetical protein
VKNLCNGCAVSAKVLQSLLVGSWEFRVIGGALMDCETYAIDIEETSPDAIVLRLRGEFDLVCEPALQDALDGLGQRSLRSLVVDLSEAQFMGVGSLRRIVFAGRGFASTEFRSPLPLVEKVLRLLGFVDGTVEIGGGAACAPPPCSVDKSSEDSPLNALEKEWRASEALRQRSDARGALKVRMAAQASSNMTPPLTAGACASQQSLDQT